MQAKHIREETIIDHSNKKQYILNQSRTNILEGRMNSVNGER